MKANQKQEGTFRLTDIVVEEVSLVDRPANLQPFLIVKRDTSPAGSEVVEDEGGELIIDQGSADDTVNAATRETETKADDREPAEKAGAKMSAARFEQLARAVEILLSLRDSLTPAKADEEKTRKNDDDDERAALLDTVKEQADRIGQLTGEVDKLSKAVAKADQRQQQRQQQQRQQQQKKGKRRGVSSNALPVEKGLRSDRGDDVAWPMDLNREQTRKNTPQHVSFFDD